jgi:hypothetical protein
MASDFDAVQVKKKIEAAFADVPYPGDENLVRSTNPENLDAAKFFKGVKWWDWKDRPSELLSPKINGYLFFLSPAAFRYYLPLYMIQALVDYNRSDLLPGEVISSLAPPDKEHINKHVTKRISLLTTAELEAIHHYLEFFRREHGDDFATWPIDAAIVNIQQAIKNNTHT